MTTPQQLPLQQAELLDNMLTAVVCIDSHLQIIYANQAAEQLFFASKTRLLQRHILPYLQEHNLAITTNEQLKASKPIQKHKQKSSRISPLKKLKQLARPKKNNNKKVPSTHQTFNFVQATQQALVSSQIFTQRDAYIYINYHKKMVDYSVTPVLLDKSHATKQPQQSAHLPHHYFILEFWQKDRHSRISKEEQNAQQHAIARKLIRGVAHEVKNPLAGIRGAAQLLARSIDQADLQAYIDIIIQETDRLKELANTMLGSHKLLTLQPINIHEPIEHVIQLVTNQHQGIHIERDYDLSLPELTADRAKLIQVILNIAINAIQAMTEAETDSPTLTFSTRVQYRYTVAGVLYRQVLRIDISDNGPGIAPELIDTLFYPMVTGRATGTGLGLSLAQDMIHQHHGMIECDSYRGKTTFSIFIPWQDG